MRNKDLVHKFHDISSGGVEFKLNNKITDLAEHLDDILGENKDFEANLKLKSIDSRVELKGQFKGALSHSCSRCAEEFKTTIDKGFTTHYFLENEKIKNFSQPVAAPSESFDVEFLTQDEINLAEVLHEQIALEMPFKPLCKEDCQGLCTSCGINLNLSKCECKTLTQFKKVSPFEVLKDLKPSLP